MLCTLLTRAECVPFMNRYRKFSILLFAIALLGLVMGWRLFGFMCDDAFIAFRYVSNAIAGFGYVWNPPPFRPVEGYTSFLWVLLMDGIWRLLGIEPPAVANYVTLLFCAGTLGLSSLLFHSILAAKKTAPRRQLIYFGIFLLGVVTNRTFLTWASSGLETAMFGFLVMLWLYGCWKLPDQASVWMSRTAFVAMLLVLTRPDGAVFYGITILIWMLIHKSEGLFLALRRHVKQLLPLIPALIHLVWRRFFYGDWVPNTYRAKHLGAWPKAGALYLFSFLWEYGFWLWFVLAIVVLYVRWASRNLKTAHKSDPSEQLHLRIRALAITALVFHTGYYTFIIGGDHFEYRVYNHLIPLLWIALFWMIEDVRWKAGPTFAFIGAALFLSWPLPWSHWWWSRQLNTREETSMMHVRVAPHWPHFVRWYAEPFDNVQAWLISHLIGTRHQEHKVASEWWLGKVLLPREEGAKISSESYPVMAASGLIGGIGWVLPNVSFIDTFGLNDYVVAHQPIDPNKNRYMAHDHSAPDEYVNAFRPNVILRYKGVDIIPRQKPLTVEEIIEIETKWRQFVAQH
jgi:arabinofuranosyltransferase